MILLVIHAQRVHRHPQSPEEGVGSPAHGVTDSCKLPQPGCWALKPGPLQKQQGKTLGHQAVSLAPCPASWVSAVRIREYSGCQLPDILTPLLGFTNLPHNPNIPKSQTLLLDCVHL